MRVSPRPHRVRPLIAAAEIERRVTEIAHEVDRDYQGTDGLVLAQERNRE